MNGAFEALLKEFVNREREFGTFCEMLESDGPRVLCVCGRSGVGKSWLLAKFVHEIAVRGLRKSEVVWTDTRNHDFLGVMRKIRDDLGPQHFSAFTDLVNFYTVPQYKLQVEIVGGPNTISVAEDAMLTQSETGDIAGILIKDVMLTEPRADINVMQTERMAKLTDAFIRGMAKAVGDTTTVVFLDAVEKMSAETSAWTWGELLVAARDGQLGRTKFVLCGRETPELDRSWRFAVEIASLAPLSEEHILTYLERREIPVEGRAQLAKLLLVVTEGHTLQVATNVDSYLKRVVREAQSVG
jgi:hypothetical protein